MPPGCGQTTRMPNNDKYENFLSTQYHFIFDYIYVEVSIVFAHVGLQMQEEKSKRSVAAMASGAAFKLTDSVSHCLSSESPNPP